MPQKRIPDVSIPHRPDSRRRRGNATDAQRRPRLGRRGQVESIAERRTIALELRKAGRSYREIARQLSVDVHTAHADVAAELAALCERTVEEAKELLGALPVHPASVRPEQYRPLPLFAHRSR
jgi:hypothetical protein